MRLGAAPRGRLAEASFARFLLNARMKHKYSSPPEARVRGPVQAGVGGCRLEPAYVSRYKPRRKPVGSALIDFPAGPLEL
jgi:hypothetical protein